MWPAFPFQILFYNNKQLTTDIKQWKWKGNYWYLQSMTFSWLLKALLKLECANGSIIVSSKSQIVIMESKEKERKRKNERKACIC